MAKVLGQSGRYVTQQAINRFRRIQVMALTTVGALGVICGLVIGLSLFHGKIPPLISLILSLVFLGVDFLVWKWASRKLDVFEKQRMDMRRGATGEFIVGTILSNLPDDFCVVNDLATAFGNLDHVVIGPTGVFVVDSKNWRGIVSADGKGELLLNGKIIDKTPVKTFVGRTMAVKDKVRVLAPEFDPFFQPLFVFTSAWVDAAWGSTRSVHCIRDDQVIDYILDRNFRKLGEREIRSVAQAFLSLAKMDADFQSRAEQRGANPGVTNEIQESKSATSFSRKPRHDDEKKF